MTSDEDDELLDEEPAVTASVIPDTIEHKFTVEAECDGWRIDRFLMKKIRRLSRARVQRVIRGDLDVDGKKVARPSRAVHTGETVAFRRPAPAEPDAPRDISIVAADPEFYVIDKPAGLTMHPTARYHRSTLTNVLRERFPDEALQICHRLDRETSGLLLVARSRESAVALKRAFAKRLVKKRYLAIARGELLGERLVDAPLGLAQTAVRVRMAVRADGLPSRTRFVPLEFVQSHNCTLVQCHPETGRQHQIRAHLDHIGHPIVGDKLYPDESLFIEWADEGMSDELLARLELPRHALHAAALEFPHPTSGQPVRVESPLPVDLAAYLHYK